MVYYQKAHDAAGVAYTYRNMARSYEYLEMPDSTHFYYRTAYTHAKTFQEREVANQILDEYLSYLVTIHDIESYQTWVAQQERPKSMENDAIHLCIAQPSVGITDYHFVILGSVESQMTVSILI